MKPVLVRITTVPLSLKVLLKGQMRFMREQGFEVVMMSSDGPEIESLLEQEGCRHEVVHLTRRITPWKDLIALIKLTRRLRALRPEIVHTHTPKAGLIGMWAAKLAGVPIRLHTIAGLPWTESSGLMRKILIGVEHLTAFAATRIYPNSNQQMQFLKSHGIAEKKMMVLGQGSSNGIDLERFTLTPALQEKAEALKQEVRLYKGAWIWVFVGRLVKDKGMAELMAAFRRFYRQFPEDQLWLIGAQEPELDPLDEKTLELLKTSKNVRCWGFQEDVRPFLAAANALVFPSYREGFPNVPLQAGALECALVLSDINGCNEIVEHEKDGYLVKPKDVNDLVYWLIKLREQDGKGAEFATGIREKIVANFDQRVIWSALLNQYKTLLQEKNKTRPDAHLS
jgi:glycosyltransferase involved in cell wall biosynthesis